MNPESLALIQEKKTGDENSPIWYTNYITTLREYLSGSKKPALREAVRIALEKGILNHYAPEDDAVLEKRSADGKFVWQKGQKDPELYERLYYAAEASREMREYSTDPSIVNAVYTILREIHDLGTEQRAEFFGIDMEKDSDNQNRNEAETLLSQLQKLVLEMYHELGGSRELRIISQGTRIKFHGITCTVSGYSWDGGMKIEADDESGHMELFKFVSNKKSFSIEPKDFLSGSVEFISNTEN